MNHRGRVAASRESTMLTGRVKGTLHFNTHALDRSAISRCSLPDR